MDTPRPYTTQLQAGLGMVRETISILRLWEPGDTTVSLANKAIAQGVFSRSTARRTLNLVREMFAPRFLREAGRSAQVLKVLVEAKVPLDDLTQLFFLHTARAVSCHGSLGRSDRGNQGNGRRLGVAAGWGMARPSWWTLSPRPPGIYRFLPCSSRGDKEEPGEPPRKSTRRSAVCRAPVGARVPSLESSILRWSKGGYFPFPFPWGCLGWERGKVRLSW